MQLLVKFKVTLFHVMLDTIQITESVLLVLALVLPAHLLA